MKDNMIEVLLSRAENDNCEISQYALVDYYIKTDSIRALFWLGKSVKQEYPLAEMYLGILCFQGKIIERDYKKAYKYLTKSIRQSRNPADTIAAEYLVRMYEHGLGVKRDLQKAFDMYTEMAEAGNMMGKFGLEYFYLNEYTREFNFS